MFKNYLICGLSAVIFSMSTALAGEIMCSGKVDILSYHAPDKMMLKLSGMNTAVFFCSTEGRWTVSGTHFTTGPETCKTLYSVFLAAQLAGKTLDTVYFDGDNTPTHCNGFSGSWLNFNIRYFQLK